MSLTSAQLDDPAERRPAWGLLNIVLMAVFGILTGLVGAVAAVVVLRLLGMQPSNGALFFILSAVAYTAFIVGVWLFVVLLGRASWGEIGFQAVGLGAVATVLLAVPVVLALNATVLWIMGLLLGGPIENPQAEQIAPGGRLPLADYLWLLGAVSVAAPVAEELVFRGVLYPYLRRWTPAAGAVLLSALLFAVVHVIPILIPPLVVTGIALGLLRERYGSVLPCMLLHALLNGISLTALYLATNNPG